MPGTESPRVATPGVATPVVVGAAQQIDRPEEHELLDAPGPIELMVAAARSAAVDSGVPSLLDRVGWIGVAGGFFSHNNPGAVVAEQLGLSGVGTALTTITGTAPQDLVGLACARVAAGDLDVALVLGGEARWTAHRLKVAGLEPRWNHEPGTGTPETVSSFAPEMIAEMASMGSATAAYALFEDALRVRAGRTVDEQRDHCAALWTRFSEVAEGNPYAWDRSHHDMAAIRDESDSNRMIVFPYTKALVANNRVNLSSAILITSDGLADATAVPADRRVYPLAVASSHETWEMLRRADLAGSPALHTAADTVLDHAGMTIDDITHVDLYACFPSIVQMSSAALGLSEDRQLTVTGGLGFAGAPIANAVGQSIAAMVPLVRAGGCGLVHGNGGSATKQSFAVYSPEPSTTFVNVDCQDRVDLAEIDKLDEDHAGRVTVDAAAVRFDRSGPSNVLAIVSGGDGRRAWATTADADIISRAMSDGIAGTDVTRSADGTFHIG